MTEKKITVNDEATEKDKEVKRQSPMILLPLGGIGRGGMKISETLVRYNEFIFKKNEKILFIDNIDNDND